MKSCTDSTSTPDKTHRRLSEPPWKLASWSLLLFKHYKLPTRPYRKEPGHGHSTPNLRAPALLSKPCTSLCRGPGPIAFPPKSRCKCCREARGFRPSESCLHPSSPGRRELWDLCNPKPPGAGSLVLWASVWGLALSRQGYAVGGSGLDFATCAGAYLQIKRGRPPFFQAGCRVQASRRPKRGKAPGNTQM